jgi:signal transduction histidine kinase
MRRERLGPPDRLQKIDVIWAVFAIANLFAMLLVPDWETVPFHFIWVSLTILYGFRVWGTGPTLIVLGIVMVTTGAFITMDYLRGAQPLDEITEVPLMAAMFLAMVWHARRRLRANEETERVSRENMRLLERERRFVQDASHELRTPITIALGHAELIQRQETDLTISGDAAVITDELMRLRRLVDRLLMLASTEDEGALDKGPVDLERLVVEVVHRWGATPRRWLLGEMEPATVLADPERLEVAMDAVIENAVQHTNEQDAIRTDLQRRDGQAVISIRDDGTGIAAEDLDRIFDRFARADPGRSRTTGGSGLGLSIVRGIVERHGGSVHVESTEAKGTLLEIALPVVETIPRASDLPVGREEISDHLA